jgi:hypothetical protein
LSPTTRSTISSSRTEYVSGCTSPDTSASPRPNVASTTERRRFDVTGSAVNSTPDTSGTSIRCTTTAICTSRWSMPWWSR